jgi:hypothetical protein
MTACVHSHRRAADELRVEVPELEFRRWLEERELAGGSADTDDEFANRPCKLASVRTLLCLACLLGCLTYVGCDDPPGRPNHPTADPSKANDQFLRMWATVCAEDTAAAGTATAEALSTRGPEGSVPDRCPFGEFDLTAIPPEVLEP